MAFLDTLRQQIDRSKQAFSKISSNVLKASAYGQSVAEKALPRYTAQVRGQTKPDSLSLTKDVADIGFKALDTLSAGVGNVSKESREKGIIFNPSDPRIIKSFASGVKKRFQGDTSVTVMEELPRSLGIDPRSLLGFGVGLSAEIALPGVGSGEKKAAEKALVLAKSLRSQADDLIKVGNNLGARDLLRPIFKAIEDITNSNASREEIIEAVSKIGKELPDAFKSEADVIVRVLSEKVAKQGDEIPKYIGSVNKERLVLNSGADKVLKETYEKIGSEVQETLGRKVTHQEIQDLAKQVKAYSTTITPEESAEVAARFLRTRENLTYLANNLEQLKKTGANPGEVGKITKELIENLKIVSSRAKDKGVQLNALKIAAKGESEQVKIIQQIIDKSGAMGNKIDEIVEASTKYDLNNLDDLTKFYRTYIKPSKADILDEYRYINLLSNPRTHIVNAFTNLLQSVVRPIDKLASGSIDYVVSGLTGKERDIYVREVPEYLRGSINAIPKAFRQMRQAFNQGVMERPDVIKIPTGKFPKLLTTPLRALNAADVFFRNIISGGEFESLVYREMRKKGTQELAPEVVEGLRNSADDLANKYLFRKRGGGGVIDALSSTVKEAGEKHRVLRWFVPFVETPANILKEGIERTPGVGLVALKNAPTKADKMEVLGRQAVGSSVLMAGAYLALSDRMTFSAPKGKNQAAAFYASGKQPYSVKIGDKWVQYSRLGPLAFPLAVAGAYKQTWDEDERLQAGGNEARGFTEKNARALLAMSEFFADQSYIQNMGNLYDAVFDNNYAKLERILANTLSQVIPADALLGFATRIVDDTYRNPDGVADILKTQLPLLSTQVESYKTPSGAPSKRQNVLFNALSPVSVTEDKPSATLKRGKLLKKPQPLSKKKDKFVSPTQ